MRTTSIKNILGVTLLATAALFGQACSSGKCNNVTCGTYEACDPTDGTCKCGGRQGGDGGVGGVVCAAGERCDGTLQQCVSDVCTNYNCSNGNSCVPVNGAPQCQCGGTVCGASQICDQILHQCISSLPCENVLCPGGETCDTTSGNCVCGDAPGCMNGQACVPDAGCQNDPCYGLHCSGAGMACYAANGVGTCRCGNSMGPACNQDEICQGNACVISALCTNVICSPGNVCSAQDGRCHCAAVDGPICTGASTCVLYFPGSGLSLPNGEAYPDSGIIGLCRGGNLCDSVTCGSKLETLRSHHRQLPLRCDHRRGPAAPVVLQRLLLRHLRRRARPPQCFQPCDPVRAELPDVGAAGGRRVRRRGTRRLADPGLLLRAGMNALVCEPVLKPQNFEGQPVLLEQRLPSRSPVRWSGLHAAQR